MPFSRIREAIHVYRCGKDIDTMEHEANVKMAQAVILIADALAESDDRAGILGGPYGSQASKLNIARNYAAEAEYFYDEIKRIRG